MDSEILVHKEFRTWIIRGWFYVERFPDRKYKFRHFNWRTSRWSWRPFGIYYYSLRFGRYEVTISTMPAFNQWTREDIERGWPAEDFEHERDLEA